MIQTIDTAILFLTHDIDQEILSRFHLIHDSCYKKYDVYFAINNESNQNIGCLHGFNIFTFTCDEIMTQGYTPHGNKVLHNVNYVMQLFRKKHSEYNYYWKVEYDVVFTGKWQTLFSFYDGNKSDFIASHIERYSKSNYDWPWWYADWKENRFSLQQCVKSFNPIVRISDKALDFMDKFLKKGIMGHFELIEATVLFNNGFCLLDLGGTGEFSDPDYPNHFYIQEKGINAGSMRWRPLFSKEELEGFAYTNKLFHPLKTPCITSAKKPTWYEDSKERG